MIRRIYPLYSLRLLGQAGAGVLIGVLVAMIVVQSLPLGGRPTVAPEGILSWNLHNIWIKPREKGFYLLSLLLGFMGACATTSRLWTVNTRWVWLGLSFSILLTTRLAHHYIHKNHSIFLLLIVSAITMAIILSVSRTATPYQKTTLQPAYQFRLNDYLPLLLIIVGILLPQSFRELASRIGMQFHLVSFLIGPALYFLGDHLIPGTDYFTQYGVGMGWLFSYMLGASAEQAVLNYTRFIIIAMFLFYAQLLYLLHWLYRAWLPAAMVTFLALILLFVTNIHFYAPSSSVLRYPLLGVSGWLLAKWIDRTSLPTTLALAFTIALSLFFNTETGIIIGLAVALAALISSPRFMPTMLAIIQLALLTLAVFALLLLFIFGPAILTGNALSAWITPLLIYGKIGFGGYPIAWDLHDLNWLYNFVAPGLSIATLALIYQLSRRADSDRPRVSVLAFFAISGLLMLGKYINMSFIAIWQMSALGLLVILAWWVMALAHLAKHRFSSSTFVWIIALLGVGWLATFSSDSRNPSRYGLQSWVLYPSWVSARLHVSHYYHPPLQCDNFTCVPNPATPKDIALIQQRTKMGEQVAILGLYDWTYLIGAHRAPLMFFLPSDDIFTEQQLSESLKRLNTQSYLFIPKGKNNEPDFSHNDIKKALSPTFHDDYVLDGVGDTLVAWKRK